MHLAIELLRREAERVLVMELVGDVRERRRQGPGRRQFEVAAAGGCCDLRKPFVWLLHLRAAAVSSDAASAEATEAAGTHPAAATAVASATRHAVLAGKPDRVHHHVLFLGALHHVLERFVVAAEVHRHVDAVGEDEHDATALLEQEFVDAGVDGVPEGRRPFLLQVVPENLQHRLAIRRELRRVDLDVSREAADARLVRGIHRGDEGLRRPFLEIEVRPHAAAAVEQHDDGDRLDVVREQGEDLPLAVVFDREIVSRQIGHEASLRICDRRVDGDSARGAGERRLRL